MAAQRKMTNSLLSLVALLAAASAVPMLPGIGGLGGLGGFGGLGMLGYGGLPGYGAKYNGGQSTGGTAPLLPATQPVLNGVTRNIVKGGLVSGISATITPVMSNNMQVSG
ncbi:hypothetical protein V1264_023227 [Littorina saxatilis]|uniref:Uncharacterized protein n=1 Tax=Littorina saxatilis TaxID=31220 RepID=A0AAN9B6K8_9CAEN